MTFTRTYPCVCSDHGVARRKPSLLKRLGLLPLAAAVIAGGIASGATGTTPPTYSLSATSKCLARHGAKVGPVKPRDSRLRALRDLAQRNSIEADFKAGRVGIAFSKSTDDAKLLVELLTVPKDPYRLVRRNNAVLLYKPKDRAAYSVAVACLKP